MMKRGKQVVAALLAVFMLLLWALPVQAASRDELVNKLISVAQNEVGYEGTRSYSKYGEWYGYQGGWCTTFALWCFYKTGSAYHTELYGNIVPSGGNCNSMISWFKNKNRYHTRGSGYQPQRGDLAFFDWSGNGSAQHVGIVKSVEGGVIYTIEGNCSGKVKARSYRKDGSSAYSRISSILGYGSPDWASVTGKTTTTKKPTTTTTTKKATTTTKKETTAAATTAKPNETATTVTTTATTTTTTTTTTAAPIALKDMSLHAATNEMQVGDSVKLDYTVKPAGASAVIGYFCDEENVVAISDTGMITATGEGTATVVVCANDTIYRQWDFTVTAPRKSVTEHSPQAVTTLPRTPKKSVAQRLGEIGVNLDKLKAHRRYYVYPLSLLGITALAVLAVQIVKAVARKRRGDK